MLRAQFLYSLISPFLFCYIVLEEIFGDRDVRHNHCHQLWEVSIPCFLEAERPVSNTDINTKIKMMTTATIIVTYILQCILQCRHLME